MNTQDFIRLMKTKQLLVFKLNFCGHMLTIDKDYNFSY